MNQRDRLTELVIESVDGCARNWAETIADHLLANGVIVPPCKVLRNVYVLPTIANNFTDVTEQTYKNGYEAGKKDKWISVKESLPEKGTRALTVRFDYVTNTQFIDILIFDGEWWNGAYRGDYVVSHWMQLPEPPKED